MWYGKKLGVARHDYPCRERSKEESKLPSINLIFWHYLRTVDNLNASLALSPGLPKSNTLKNRLSWNLFEKPAETLWVLYPAHPKCPSFLQVKRASWKNMPSPASYFATTSPFLSPTIVQLQSHKCRSIKVSGKSLKLDFLVHDNQITIN